MEHNRSHKGTLFVVATPIGNLGDMTPRAVDVLKSAVLIAAEDTRTAKKLLARFGVKTPLTSCFEHNESAKIDEIISAAKSGGDVALISEAGTPSVSDPGYRLITRAIENGMRLVPVPGPSAVIAALSVSGLPTDRFLFVGFLPDKEGRRRKKLEGIKDETATLIFFVSKWKLEKTLDDMLEILGGRKVCYCRELTKFHEEIIHTTLSELAPLLRGREVKGEITLVVSGSEQ